MIYIIISNIGLAVMMLIIYFRYSHFRVTSTFKIRDLEKRLTHEITDKEAIKTNLTNEVKSEVDQVKQLLKSIDKMRKEKEDESRLRFEAEKQIELALQKTQEIQRRMDDWKKIQDAAMSDAKGTIMKVGTDLFEKLTQNHKQEVDESRSDIDEKVKNVYGYLEKISKNVESFKIKSEVVAQRVVNVAAASSAAAKPAIPVDPMTKQAISSVVENVKLSGHQENKVYIAESTLDADKAKMLLCDLVFLKDDVLHVIDFKSMRYFQDYNKAKVADKAAAAENLKKKLDKYIAYISNPKYVAAIGKLAAALKMQFAAKKVVFIVNSKNEMATLKEIKYLEKAEKSGLEIFDIDAVNDLVL